jgi:hypothetical protein
VDNLTNSHHPLLTHAYPQNSPYIYALAYFYVLSYYQFSLNFIEHAMAHKKPLIHLPHVENRQQLEEALSVLYVRGHLSRTQWIVICLAAAPSLPGAIELHQRTPKGVTYVRAGADAFRVNVRAKLVRVYPYADNA